ncbi:MAG: hypothetical protein ACOY3N_11710 [Bradyrhizobium sp.]|jgi:hypothetical protein|uniref:hypothetical protein n=1 Tax=unclassified Bradyrhizobium TaxID=2631580 RepID=UPI0007147239|nr:MULTISPECIES: hypothetical protein [unclassified Bradyrhizobium]KQT12108.1 hypothetical protein ASG57_34875 [Bradyrhizobium sp. Leaf396]
MAMRAEIKRAIEAASRGETQQLYWSLVVMGNLLSNALDRIDALEKVEVIDGQSEVDPCEVRALVDAQP